MIKTLIASIAMLAVFESAMAQNAEAVDSLERQLNEVVVTAKQPATKLVGTTLVSTIPGSNLADLGTALDVLAQLPMITVSDNTVGVVGKGSVEIYIDGRPMRDDMELQQMLSSNIKKVELVMAPGAAYESTTQAVLKITTKRNFVQGLSLTDRFEITRRRRWSAMDYLGIGYRAGKWEAFADGVLNRNDMLSKGVTTNALTYEGKPTVVGASQRNSYPTTTGAVKAGFNYADGAQSFGAYYRFNPERGDFLNTGSEWLDDAPVISRDIDKSIRARSHLASMYYENTFADRYLLHFDGDFKQSRTSSHVTTAYPSAGIADVNSSDVRKSTLVAGKLYLNFPLWRGDFTIGTQDSYTRTSLDFAMLNAQVGQYIPSSLTDARQTSASLFASWSRMFGVLSLTAGARYEYVDYDFKVDGERDGDVSRRDHLLTPNVSVGYAFSDDAQLSLSYKLATVKPSYQQLTGSLSYVGRHEIEGGNPALRDERLHTMQLFGMWDAFMLQASYQRSIDAYAFVKQVYPAADLQLLMHPVNIDVSALSVYLVWSKPLRRWTPSVTAGAYRQWLTLGPDRYDKPIFVYYFDNVFDLPGGWNITANINGQSQGDMHTNRFGASWFVMDASVGKSFLDKALALKLTATDIFNTANNNWTMRTCGISVDKRQSYDHRGLQLSLTYRFQPRKSKYKGAPASESELNRL